MTTEKYFQIKWMSIHVAKVVQVGPGTAGTWSPNMEIMLSVGAHEPKNAVILFNIKYLQKGLYIPSTALKFKVALEMQFRFLSTVGDQLHSQVTPVPTHK